MKKLGVLLGILILVLSFSDTAAAEYNSEDDLILSVNLLSDSLELSDDTGEATFELQESAHEILTSYSGFEVDHSYVWLEINGYSILAVDPPKPCF